MKIAFLGLGNMGLHMARNLLRAGHDVTVWNRTLSKADELRTDNANVADSVAEAARGADVVITMMADDHAVQLSRARCRRPPREPRSGSRSTSP